MPEASLHERALELAIAALDFELEPDERTWLDGHLATCSACRGATARYASDARGLERLPAFSAPARVETRVLGARGRPPPRSSSFGWLAVGATLVVVIAIAGAALLRRPADNTGPGASVASVASVASAVASAVPSARSPSTSASSASPAPPSQAASPSLPPTAPPPAPSLVWRPVAAPDDAVVREVRGLTGAGDVAVATLLGPNGEPRLWSSRAGGPWQDAELPNGAFGGTAPWLMGRFGTGFIALGWTNVDEAPLERRIWLSPDGLAWRPDVADSGRLGPMVYGQLAAGRGTALVMGRSEGETVGWRSTDGETWTPLEVGEPARGATIDGLVTAADGTFLAFGTVDGSPGILTTADGERWAALASPPDLSRIVGMTSLATGVVAWGATAGAQDTNALAWSADGLSWEPITPPAGVSSGDTLAWIAGDGAGLVAMWQREDGSPVHGRSPDGRAWAAVQSEGLPDGVSFDYVARVGDRLVGLGVDADGVAVSYATGG